MSKKNCLVNGAPFTLKNCSIHLDDLIKVAVGQRNQPSLAVAVNNQLVQIEIR